MTKKSKVISKEALIAEIAQKAGISLEKATIAYETVLLESPAFRKQELKTVELKTEKTVNVPGKAKIKKVKLKKEKAVKEGNTIEKIKIVEVEVPVPVEKVVEVIKEVEIVKEVPVVIEKMVVKEVEVIKEVPIEVIKEVTLVREVEKKIIEKIEVIKEVPVEIIREVEVVKQIDFSMLEEMMKGMKTVEVSKKVIGETRIEKEGKIVERRPVTNGTPKAEVKDDLKKIEGIGPKIAELLNNAGIKTFKKLSKTEVKDIKKILLDAGSRFQMHDPGSWPKQAGLAAAGKWDELAALQEVLDGGK